MLATGALVISQPPVVMFALLLGAGVVSDIVGEASQLYLYRRSS
jgi:hypothetical protein